ncbi:hypothetical protein FH972_005349 [Carpinus fangiana]|uniref:Uncharacterized protein n=1 Tax=Carpinus fangiana TaxID=176857 RepID=A0A5N6QQS7_9ROSI|nr:hypothetical protein FH972_005349 [Carpinus fangiana]
MLGLLPQGSLANPPAALHHSSKQPALLAMSCTLGSTILPTETAHICQEVWQHPHNHCHTQAWLVQQANTFNLPHCHLAAPCRSSCKLTATHTLQQLQSMLSQLTCPALQALHNTMAASNLLEGGCGSTLDRFATTLHSPLGFSSPCAATSSLIFSTAARHLCAGHLAAPMAGFLPHFSKSAAFPANAAVFKCTQAPILSTCTPYTMQPATRALKHPFTAPLLGQGSAPKWATACSTQQHHSKASWAPCCPSQQHTASWSSKASIQGLGPCPAHLHKPSLQSMHFTAALGPTSTWPCPHAWANNPLDPLQQSLANQATFPST